MEPHKISIGNLFTWKEPNNGHFNVEILERPYLVRIGVNASIVWNCKIRFVDQALGRADQTVNIADLSIE